jgi:hypothetical protein
MEAQPQIRAALRSQTHHQRGLARILVPSTPPAMDALAHWLHPYRDYANTVVRDLIPLVHGPLGGALNPLPVITKTKRIILCQITAIFRKPV